MAQKSKARFAAGAIGSRAAGRRNEREPPVAEPLDVGRPGQAGKPRCPRSLDHERRDRSQALGTPSARVSRGRSSTAVRRPHSVRHPTLGEDRRRDDDECEPLHRSSSVPRDPPRTRAGATRARYRPGPAARSSLAVRPRSWSAPSSTTLSSRAGARPSRRRGRLNGPGDGGGLGARGHDRGDRHLQHRPGERARREAEARGREELRLDGGAAPGRATCCQTPSIRCDSTARFTPAAFPVTHSGLP